jgi:hypothetical protein
VTDTPQYVAWLAAQGVPLIEAGGITWRRYRSALVPADPTQPFVQVERGAMGAAVHDAHVPFARWSTDPTSAETQWWHVVCSHFAQADLSSKTRGRVRRALAGGGVRRLSPEWLATNGYPCYLAAFQRYRGATPTPEAEFRAELLAQADAPVEIWGAFEGEDLVAYVRIVIEADRAAFSSMKITPAARRGFGGYALLSVVLQDLVAERGVSVQNGARPVNHETEIQDFLLKFGFERRYGRLEIVYSRSAFLAAMVARLVDPLSALVPEPARTSVRTLALQERIRRSAGRQATDSSVTPP